MASFSITDTRRQPQVEGIQDIIATTELVDVRVDEVHAGPVATTAGDVTVRLARGEPQFASPGNAGHLMVRLEHRLTCEGEGDPEVTSLQVFHVLHFELKDDLMCEAADLAGWIQTNVYFIAYPYVRQFITTMTAALGMSPVVLGYMKREDWPEFEETSDPAEK